MIYVSVLDQSVADRKGKKPVNPHLDRPINIPRKSLVRRLGEAQKKSGLGGKTGTFLLGNEPEPPNPKTK
jgi:hypothetical protein